MKNFIRWLLFTVAFLMILTGYGISNYRVVQVITYNLLPKNLLFQIHSVLGLPFIVLLFLHIFLAIKSGHKR